MMMRLRGKRMEEEWRDRMMISSPWAMEGMGMERGKGTTRVMKMEMGMTVWAKRKS